MRAVRGAVRAALGVSAGYPRGWGGTNLELRWLEGELLGQPWSPQQISRHLRRRFPDQSAIWIRHERYQAVYRLSSVPLRPSKRARSIVRRFAPAAAA
jgi:IS30 family transposase